jgi:hypothetical protein
MGRRQFAWRIGEAVSIGVNVYRAEDLAGIRYRCNISEVKGVGNEVAPINIEEMISWKGFDGTDQ